MSRRRLPLPPAAEAIAKECPEIYNEDVFPVGNDWCRYASPASRYPTMDEQEVRAMRPSHWWRTRGQRV